MCSMNDAEKNSYYRSTHLKVYQSMPQIVALTIIKEDYPEYSRVVEQMIEEEIDVADFLSILDSFC